MDAALAWALRKLLLPAESSVAGRTNPASMSAVATHSTEAPADKPQPVPLKMLWTTNLPIEQLLMQQEVKNTASEKPDLKTSGLNLSQDTRSAVEMEGSHCWSCLSLLSPRKDDLWFETAEELTKGKVEVVIQQASVIPAKLHRVSPVVGLVRS